MSFEDRKQKIESTFNNPILKGMMSSTKIESYSSTFRKSYEPSTHNLAQSLMLDNSKILPASRGRSRDSTKPNTQQTSRRQYLTSAEKHRHDRLKQVQFMRIKENDQDNRLINKIQESKNIRPMSNSSNIGSISSMSNLMSSRPKSTQQPLYDLEKNKKIRDLHSKIYNRSRSKNDLLSKIGYDLKKDLEINQKQKDEEKKLSDSIPKTWMPSIIANTNVELKLDLNLLPLLPHDMQQQTLYKKQLNKNTNSNLHNTTCRFQVSKNINQRQFYSGFDNTTSDPIDTINSISGAKKPNDKLNFQNDEKESRPMLILMDNSKLTIDGMICYYVNLELVDDDNLATAKTKILTKINTEIRKLKTCNFNTSFFKTTSVKSDPDSSASRALKELSVIKNIKLLDGSPVETVNDLKGACDVLIVSASTISNGLDWESLSIIPDIEKLEKIFKSPEFAFKIFLFLGKRFIDNLKDQHKLEIQTVKMAEIIYEDFEKIQSMFEQYISDVMNIKRKYNQSLSSYQSTMLEYIKNNCSLMCDLIDDLLNISRKEYDITSYDRVQVNFKTMSLVMLARDKSLKPNLKEGRSKFNRLQELLKIDKNEIIQRTRITIMLLQRLCSQNELVLDDKIDKLIKDLLFDYELSINFQNKQLKHEKLRNDDKEFEDNFLNEIEIFEKDKNKQFDNHQIDVDKDMQEFINLQGGHIDVDQNDNNNVKYKSNKKMTMDQINSKVLKVEQSEILSTLDTMRNYEKEVHEKAIKNYANQDELAESKEVLNDFWRDQNKKRELTNENKQIKHKKDSGIKITDEQQMGEQIEKYQRLTEDQLNKMADKLNIKKHRIHELTCLQKSMIQVTAKDEKAKGVYNYNFRKGVNKDTFKSSIQRFSLEDDEFIKSIYKVQAPGGYLSYENFLQLMSSVDQSDIEGKVEFFMKITDDNGTNTLDDTEVRATCNKVIEGIVNFSKNEKQNEKTKEFVDGLTDQFQKQIYSICGKEHNKGHKIIKDDLIEAAKRDPWNYKLIRLLCSA